MKRLTKRWGAQPHPNLSGKVICEYQECDSTKSCENCIHGRYKDRLAAIEDILGDEYDLDRLREILEADRDGRCMVLPCKVGDKLYITCGDISEYTVYWIRYDGITIWAELRNEKYCEEHRTTDRCISFDINKTVFLTREAAEAALKGEKDG